MATTKRANRDRLHALVSSFRDTPDDLVFWSFRYFLGRMTIHTCCFAEDLARAWSHLDERVAGLIRKELDEAFRKDDELRSDEKCSRLYSPLGMDCDRAAWECVRRAYTANASLDRPAASAGTVGGVVGAAT